jgi:hypothetical protein
VSDWRRGIPPEPIARVEIKTLDSDGRLVRRTGRVGVRVPAYAEIDGQVVDGWIIRFDDDDREAVLHPRFPWREVAS